jgi:hypothetical protein
MPDSKIKGDNYDNISIEPLSIIPGFTEDAAMEKPERPSLDTDEGGSRQSNGMNDKTFQMIEVLRKRHPSPKWVFLTEVRTRTGYSTTYGEDMDSERYIDAFALCVWKSGNYQRIVYELKISRSDWLSELSNPAKKAQAFFLSHQFWFVLAPGVYIREDYQKVDSGCGIMEILDDGTVNIILSAAKRNPFPMPETFVASIVRRAAGITKETE